MLCTDQGSCEHNQLLLSRTHLLQVLCVSLLHQQALLLAVVLQTMPPSQPDAPTGGQGPPRAVEALMTLDLLPAELWRAVAAYLSAEDRTAFRAVSKARSS